MIKRSSGLYWNNYFYTFYLDNNKLTVNIKANWNLSIRSLIFDTDYKIKSDNIDLHIINVLNKWIRKIKLEAFL